MLISYPLRSLRFVGLCSCCQSKWRKTYGNKKKTAISATSGLSSTEIDRLIWWQSSVVASFLCFCCCHSIICSFNFRFSFSSIFNFVGIFLKAFVARLSRTKRPERWVWNCSRVSRLHGVSLVSFHKLAHFLIHFSSSAAALQFPPQRVCVCNLSAYLLAVPSFVFNICYSFPHVWLSYFLISCTFYLWRLPTVATCHFPMLASSPILVLVLVIIIIIVGVVLLLLHVS